MRLVGGWFVGHRLGFPFVRAVGQLGGVFFGQQAVDELRFTVVADGDDGAALGYGVGVKVAVCLAWMASMCFSMASIWS